MSAPSGSGVKVLKSGKIHTGAIHMRNTWARDRLTC